MLVVLLLLRLLRTLRRAAGRRRAPVGRWVAALRRGRGRRRPARRGLAADTARGSRVEKNKTSAIDAYNNIVKNVHRLRGIPVLRNIKNTAATA